MIKRLLAFIVLLAVPTRAALVYSAGNPIDEILNHETNSAFVGYGDDYDTGAAAIAVTSLTFTGAVTAAGGHITFAFYDTDREKIAERTFVVSNTDDTNHVLPLDEPLYIPGKGYWVLIPDNVGYYHVVPPVGMWPATLAYMAVAQGTDVGSNDPDVMCFREEDGSLTVDREIEWSDPSLPPLAQTLAFGMEGKPVTSIPGDYNSDGVVNAADYTVWADHFGSAGPLGDGNGDGAVDAADYTLWADHFGDVRPVGGPVPEPSLIPMTVAPYLALRRKR